MWDLVTHVLIGVILGWYIMPFKDGGSFRSRVNATLKSLFSAMVTAMQKNAKAEKTTTRKRTTTKKQDEPVAFKGKVCSKCKSTALMPLSGEFKGHGYCPTCQIMETVR